MEIDLSKPGAEQERSKLKRFHSALNDPNIVPEQSYRRNSIYYPLVCYVNNIIGLILSKNYEAIPIFIRRAIRHMENTPSSPTTSVYYELVLQYLKQVTYVLKNFTAISEESLVSFIPKHILDAGSQPIPNTSLNRNEDKY
jgi:hypothetical protein